MTTLIVNYDASQLTNDLTDLSLQQKQKNKLESSGEGQGMACDSHHGDCAICLNKILLQETALVKGCEHAYCVSCILQWATYKEKATCPQCKHPFVSLAVHRSLDGSIHDYMYEESVCLLLRASWFKPLVVEERAEPEYDPFDDYYYTYEDDDEDDMDEVYMDHPSNLRIGNRRWGGNGYVRGGRQEARPAHRPNSQDTAAGPSREPKKKEAAGSPEALVGRRAKRALKREAADKAAAEKHEKLLMRLGRK